jgi:hypothetical protein
MTKCAACRDGEAAVARDVAGYASQRLKRVEDGGVTVGQPAARFRVGEAPRGGGQGLLARSGVGQCAALRQRACD